MICSNSLSNHLRRLSEQQHIIDWSDIENVMSAEENWDEKGAKFWDDLRDPCPRSLTRKVLSFLRVRDGSNKWTLVSDVWLLEGNSLCLKGLFIPWRRGNQLNDNLRKHALVKLKSWEIYDHYIEAVQDKIEKDYPGVFTQRIEVEGLGFLDNAIQSISTLERQWQPLVKGGVRKSMTNFLNSECKAKETLLSRTLDVSMREVVSWLPEYRNTPDWLTLDIENLINGLNIPQHCYFKLLTKAELTVDTKKSLAQELLRKFYLWKGKEISSDQTLALKELFRDVTSTWEIRISSGTPKFLSQFIDHTSGGGVDFNLLTVNNGQMDWRESEQLPEPLTNIAPIADTCLTLGELARKVKPAEGERPILAGQLTDELRQNESFNSLYSKYQDKTLIYTTRLAITWHCNNKIVCGINDAMFAVDEENIYVTQADISSDDAQAYADVISNYLQRSADKEVDKYRKTHPPEVVYDKFRNRILKTFRREFVNDAGYRCEHILRELLQNAESAYASKKEKPNEMYFSVCMNEVGATGKESVEISHQGRCFNEIDKSGNERDDIRRIVSTAPIDVAMEDEVGRFNRGFKSVFDATDSVKVKSGPYEFNLRDFLLVDPQYPVASCDSKNTKTLFSFETKTATLDNMLGWSKGSRGVRRIGVFNEFSFVFLRYITSVVMKRGKSETRWTLQRKIINDNEHETVIASGSSTVDKFVNISEFPKGLVIKPADRVDVAILVNDNNIPKPSLHNQLYVTFPVSTKGPTGFLINAPFDVDQGRTGILPKSRNAALVKAAFSIARQKTEVAIKECPEIEVWLAWAAIWDIASAQAWIKSHFSDDSMQLTKDLGEVRDLFLKNIPVNGRLQHAESLIFPTRLMRTISEIKGTEWSIDQSEWMSQEICDVISSIAKDWQRYSFIDYIEENSDNQMLLNEIHLQLNRTCFTEELGKGVVELREIDSAKDKLSKLLQQQILQLQDFIPVPVKEPDRKPVQAPEVLYNWWNENCDLTPYVLEGAWWDLLFPENLTESTGRRKGMLCEGLSNPDNDEGKLLWYKVLSLPCLMGTGRQMTAVRDFWINRLNTTDFFNVASSNNDDIRKVFDDAIHHKLKGDSATGEDAVFWRRVFYDIRKIRTLVYENDFASVILEVASNDVCNLVRFMRNGTIPGQQDWAGVMGQSAGGPLFFVMRELRRLGVIESAEADSSCYFVCKPVRRAAYELGWIDQRLRDRYDFSSLQEASRCIYEIITEDGEVGDNLLPLYDIPLMHYHQKLRGQ